MWIQTTTMGLIKWQYPKKFNSCFNMLWSNNFKPQKNIQTHVERRKRVEGSSLEGSVQRSSSLHRTAQQKEAHTYSEELWPRVPHSAMETWNSQLLRTLMRAQSQHYYYTLNKDIHTSICKDTDKLLQQFLYGMLAIKCFTFGARDGSAV